MKYKNIKLYMNINICYTVEVTIEEDIQLIHLIITEASLNLLRVKN